MSNTKADIIAHLRRQIIPLQSVNPTLKNVNGHHDFNSLKNIFPLTVFPPGAVHEFLSSSPEDAAATSGFIAGLLSLLMKKSGTAIWISSSASIFPPALKKFGVKPDKIIFIKLYKEKEIHWVMEEALKCKGLSAVICETKELSFTASRRLQLAVEQSQVTGFVIHDEPPKINTTACFTRWRITHLQTDLKSNLPGVGFPRWNVNLLKVRNGKPGNWQIEWTAGKFRHLLPINLLLPVQQKKTG